MEFTEQLSFILEDSPVRYNNSLDDANSIVKEIEKSQQYIVMLHNKLKSIKRRINSELAIKVRHRNPGLNVSVNPKKCKIGYKSKFLSFYPDVERHIWLVSSSDEKFSNKFLKNHRRSTIMSDDINELASAITTYFINYYKSLNENIIGDGAIIIDDNKARLLNLVEYGNET